MLGTYIIGIFGKFPKDGLPKFNLEALIYKVVSILAIGFILIVMPQ